METDNYLDEAELLGQVIKALQAASKEARQRIYDSVGVFFALNRTSQAITTASEKPIVAIDYSPRAQTTELELTPKDFLLQKQPRTDMERIACLAYYLTHYRDLQHFTTLDISKLNTEAAQPKFSNAAYTMNNASAAGYLVPAGKGTKQLSANGERYVQLLPDYDSAKMIMSVARQRRKQKRTPTKK